MADWIEEAAKDVCKMERRIFGGQAHCHEMTDVIAKVIREAYQRQIGDTASTGPLSGSPLFWRNQASTGYQERGQHDTDGE